MNNYVTGNLEAARKTYELWAQTYPRDDIPPDNLGAIYGDLGDYDKALAAKQEALKLSPGSGLVLREPRQRLFDCQPSG